jgi:hypothetical protein
MNHELNKEIAFDKVNRWLNDYGFAVNVTTRNRDKAALTQFESKVYPPREQQRFFFVTFGNKFDDSFSIQSNIILTAEDIKSINRLRKKEQQQVYIDIHRFVYFLNVNCDTRFPEIVVHKLIFIDSLKDKQFFFDSVFALLHAMVVVESRFEELYYSLFPEGSKST